MIAKQDYRSLQRELQAYLEECFRDVAVRIGDDIHYAGTNIVVTSASFKGLLAEQRFHHVVRALPQEFYETYFQGGVVWFELAPGETGSDLMRMPRASDVAQNEADLRKLLDTIKFFPKFQALMETAPSRASMTHFHATREILAEAGLDPDAQTRVCLFMILQGAYCDAHVLADVLPKLTSECAA